MSETAQFVIFFIGMPAALAVCMLVAVGVEWAVWQVGIAAARCQGQLSNWRWRAAQESRGQQNDKAFAEWLASKAGEDLGGSVDDRLVQAQKQAEIIRIVVEEELPKAVLRCVETHRLMANATGAQHLFEIAYEPECYQLRAGIVWLLIHTVRLLEAYPLRLDDARLLHNSIVLRKRALSTCRRCPYIQLATHEAPRLCPTAELVQVKGVGNETTR